MHAHMRREMPGMTEAAVEGVMQRMTPLLQMMAFSFQTKVEGTWARSSPRSSACTSRRSQLPAVTGKEACVFLRDNPVTARNPEVGELCFENVDGRVEAESEFRARVCVLDVLPRHDSNSF